MCNEYIPFQRMTGDGGLHLFIELEEKFMLVRFYKSVMSKGLFSHGDVFILMEKE